MSSLLRLSDEVRDALGAAAPVVALETTLVSHGFPAPHGVEVALESEARVRAAGAVPATVGVVDGTIRVGLEPAEIERFEREPVRKVGERDLADCALRCELGATTVGGTLAACRLAGIRVMATGGFGGVHRGFASTLDVSADLAGLGRTQALVVCSGMKSLLDVPATAELLETLSVPVVGWRTDRVPLFYTRDGGPAVSCRVEDAAGAAALARAHWSIAAGGLLLTRPPDPELPLDEVEALIAAALAEAEAAGISGQAVTPFLLDRLHATSGGRTLAVNRALIVDNAGLAGEIAARLAA